MKKIGFFFCVFCLLLAACTYLQSPQTTQQPQPVESFQAQTETTDLPEPSAPASCYSPQGSPTAGGIRVYTDPSTYRPYAGVEAKFTRLREEPLTSFEPSGDYGSIYPYVAARQYSSNEQGYSWQSGALYGFVDSNGRILTDGLYSSIAVMAGYDYGGYRQNQNERISCKPFWITTRYVDPTVHYVKDIPGNEDTGDHSWVDVDPHVGVIAMDGSFALPEEYESVLVLEDGFLCCRSWEDHSFDVYDDQGQLRFTDGKMSFSEYESWSLESGDGLYLLSYSTDGEGGMEGWFLDANGDRVLGPYQEAYCFSEGLAYVKGADGGKNGFIDKSGALVIEADLMSGSYFYKGLAIVMFSDGTSAVIDRAGRHLAECGSEDWITYEACGFRISAPWASSTFYDWEGNILLTSSSVYCLDELTFCEERSEGATRLFRQDGTELLIGNSVYIEPFCLVQDGAVMPGYLVHGYEDSYDDTGEYEPQSAFVPQDLSDIWMLDTAGNSMWETYNLYFTLYDRFSDEEWYLSWDKDGWNATNQEGVLCRIPSHSTDLRLFGDWIMTVTDRACIYLDRAGNVRFSYPLDAQD